jgi:hypothetical protein
MIFAGGLNSWIKKWDLYILFLSLSGNQKNNQRT